MALRPDYPGPWYVYKLIDPRNSCAFYVGLSINPQKRLRGHISRDSPCRDRLREMKRAGVACIVEIVSEHSTFTSGRCAEQSMISRLPGLLNRDRHDPFWPGCARGEPRQAGRDWLYV